MVGTNHIIPYKNPSTSVPRGVWRQRVMHSNRIKMAASGPHRSVENHEDSIVPSTSGLPHMKETPNEVCLFKPTGNTDRRFLESITYYETDYVPRRCHLGFWWPSFQWETCWNWSVDQELQLQYRTSLAPFQLHQSNVKLTCLIRPLFFFLYFFFFNNLTEWPTFKMWRHRHGYLFVLRFYGSVNPLGSCRARSVYLTTVDWAGLVLWAVNQYCAHSFARNCPSWISGRERMTIENISWSVSTKEYCQPPWGLNPRPPGLQSDGAPPGLQSDDASNWATEAGTVIWACVFERSLAFRFYPIQYWTI